MQNRTSKPRYSSSVSYCILKALQLLNFGLSNNRSPRFRDTLEVVRVGPILFLLLACIGVAQGDLMTVSCFAYGQDKYCKIYNGCKG